MTYDFETMEQSVNISISESTTINSRLILLSVASCVKLSLGLIMKHFSLRESEEFISPMDSPKSYHCTTYIKESLWTLDNAKFWYLTFYYDFMNLCLDMDKIHFIEGDTDSMYFAISGNPSIGSVEDEKKNLGCAIEKTGENMMALGPKCYTTFNSNGQTKSSKLKGVSLKKNIFKYEDYKSIIENKSIKQEKNINLQMNGNQMSKLTVQNNALTGLHTKMIVLENQSCCPYISGLTSKDYIIE